MPQAQLPRLAKIKKLERSIGKIDAVIELLHKEFPLGSREVDPVLQHLSKANQCLQNLIQTITLNN